MDFWEFFPNLAADTAIEIYGLESSAKIAASNAMRDQALANATIAAAADKRASEAAEKERSAETLKFVLIALGVGAIGVVMASQWDGK